MIGSFVHLLRFFFLFNKHNSKTERDESTKVQNPQWRGTMHVDLAIYASLAILFVTIKVCDFRPMNMFRRVITLSLLANICLMMLVTVLRWYWVVLYIHALFLWFKQKDSYAWRENRLILWCTCYPRAHIIVSTLQAKLKVRAHCLLNKVMQFILLISSCLCACQLLADKCYILATEPSLALIFAVTILRFAFQRTLSGCNLLYQ